MDNFRQAVESPKSWNSMGYICLKTTFLHLKHYLQIYLTLLSTDLWFGKWHEEYGKFFPEHSKLGFWWDPLIQTWKSMSLKSTEELSVMAMKRNWLVISKLTWGIWRILIWALESLKNFLFNGFLLNKLYITSTKKHRGVIFHQTEKGCKICWSGIIDFKISIRNLANFDLSSRKSQKCSL